ncbi:MAG: hypothetical protein RR191_05110 [Cetobacterium sp.]|uniref:LA_2272 family surface repeat-containing protein n=1 Tax=unclassified Cetobacterium TaxID=2630983 RepID=UPI00163C12B5|nr:hypothetical protein [Cetobacterium sp. 2A]MBC2856379.1 hypothetical protein [Cetobacterium sp. 2A]
MKKKIIGMSIMTSLTLLGAESFEAGFLSPMQLNGPNTSVNGIRIGAIYTENQNVEGLDLNIIANRKRNFNGLSLGSFYDRTDADFTGVRLGWFIPLSFNSVGGNMKGIQIGSVNMVEKSMMGAQLGLVNFTGTGKGLQFGAFNKADRFRGVQIGFVNYADRLEGLQIGFVNIAANSELFEVLPIVNFNFKF